ACSIRQSSNSSTSTTSRSTATACTNPSDSYTPPNGHKQEHAAQPGTRQAGMLLNQATPE
ncbi:hypothetical protein, partial [Nocardia puris]|uniref:hypothetical protein n=1 Tax=Nocardia puris TaxID=208602 RepID=UPI001B85B58D